MSSGDWSELDGAELERRHREACALLLAAHEEIARLSIAHGHALREIEVAMSDIDVLREREIALLGEVALRDEQLAGVLDSASWRLTRPLRVLKARMRESEL